MKVYYKVMTLMRESAVIRIEGFTLSYPKKKWVYPHEGKIFVFKSVEDAKRFIIQQCIEAKKIVPCEVKNSRARKYISCYHNGYDFRAFWTKRYCIRNRAPKGTYTCDAVFCLE